MSGHEVQDPREIYLGSQSLQVKTWLKRVAGTPDRDVAVNQLAPGHKCFTDLTESAVMAVRIKHGEVLHAKPMYEIERDESEWSRRLMEAIRQTECKIQGSSETPSMPGTNPSRSRQNRQLFRRCSLSASPVSRRASSSMLSIPLSFRAFWPNVSKYDRETHAIPPNNVQ